MINSYFNSIQLIFLALSFVFFLSSLILNIKSKQFVSLIFLTASAFCLYSFAALLDPFLNLWDERFHALVAKNLISNPFKPMLYTEKVIDIAYDNWDRYYIWLHKQPLFLWQMALSLKLFGLSEYALRLPNIIMATLLIPITFRMSKLLLNNRVGYLAAVLLISTIYVLELVAGRQVLEHNDMAFVFYVSGSIWAFIEYRHSNNRKWIYIIALFSGCAILVKWLVGLLIYFGWMVLRLQEKKFALNQNRDLFISVLIALAISMPWQIYAFLRFPEEALSAYRFNALHFTVPLEGHSGDVWWHLNKFDLLYGTLAPFLIIPGLIVLNRMMKDKKMYFVLLSMLIAVYLFFSMAATKMPSFTLIVITIVLLAFACLLQLALEKTEKLYKSQQWIKALIFLGLMMSIFVIRIDVEYLQGKYTLWKKSNQYSRNLIHNKTIFTSLDLPENAVLFNVKGRHYIEAMYYTDRIAYNIIPNQKILNQLKSKKLKAVIFKNPNNQIPDFIKNDEDVIIIDKVIRGYR